MATATAPMAVSSPAKMMKKKRAGGAKKPANHPTYGDMIKRGILALKEPKGVSRQGLLKYIMGNFAVGGDARVRNTGISAKFLLKQFCRHKFLKQFRSFYELFSLNFGIRRTKGLLVFKYLAFL